MMNTHLKQLNQCFLTLFAGVLFWIGLVVVNQAAAVAAPPGADNTPRTSLEFRQNKTSEIMQGAAQDNRSPVEDLRQKSRNTAQRANQASDRLMQNSQSRLENAADTVRQKLNLDEPIAPETKEFMRDVKGQVDSAVAPITGDRTGGYYSVPRR